MLCGSRVGTEHVDATDLDLKKSFDTADKFAASIPEHDKAISKRAILRTDTQSFLALGVNCWHC